MCKHRVHLEPDAPASVRLDVGARPSFRALGPRDLTFLDTLLATEELFKLLTVSRLKKTVVRALGAKVILRLGEEALSFLVPASAW